MEAQLPKVNCCICNYNKEDTVVDAVKSCLEQDYPNVSVVVCDDASTDNSVDLLVSEFKLKPWVKDKWPYTSQVFTSDTIKLEVLPERKGAAFARNRAIQQEQAHIYAILDSDDLYLNQKVSKSVAVFLQNPVNIGLVYSDYSILNSSGDVDIHTNSFNRQNLMNRCYINNGSLFTHLAYSKIGPYDEGLSTCEDYDFFLRLTEQFLAVHIPEPLLCVRQNGKNLSLTTPKFELEQNYNNTIIKLRKRLNI